VKKFPDIAEGRILLRSMESRDDFSFVWKTWIRDYAHSRNPWSGSYSRQATIDAIKATVQELLQSEDVYVVMACPVDDRDQIYGFVCFERKEAIVYLHYVYVKAAFRRHGIGSKLRDVVIEGCDGKPRYTFRTPACSKFLAGFKHDWNRIRRRKKEKANG